MLKTMGDYPWMLTFILCSIYRQYGYGSTPYNCIGFRFNR